MFFQFSKKSGLSRNVESHFFLFPVVDNAALANELCKSMRQSNGSFSESGLAKYRLGLTKELIKCPSTRLNRNCVKSSHIDESMSAIPQRRFDALRRRAPTKGLLGEREL